jgi:hypothetical protein
VPHQPGNTLATDANSDIPQDFSLPAGGKVPGTSHFQLSVGPDDFAAIARSMFGTDRRRAFEAFASVLTEVFESLPADDADDPQV